MNNNMEGVVYLDPNIGEMKQGDSANDNQFYDLINNWFSEEEKPYESSDVDSDTQPFRETCCNSRYTVSNLIHFLEISTT